MTQNSVSLIRSDTLFSGVEYAYASSAPAGTRFVFLAGSCPLDAEGNTVAVGDVAGQAAQCVANLREALSAAEATLEHATSTRVLVASSAQADLIAAWSVIREAFGDHDVPSTLMGVAALGYDHQLVELEATAALAGETSA